MVSAILTSAVIAALVSALFSVLTTERGIAAAHVTRERMKWRDKIRGLALEVYKELASHSPDSDKLNENKQTLLSCVGSLVGNKSFLEVEPQLPPAR